MCGITEISTNFNESDCDSDRVNCLASWRQPKSKERLIEVHVHMSQPRKSFHFVCVVWRVIN